jgi:hypothetical protein
LLILVGTVPNFLTGVSLLFVTGPTPRALGFILGSGLGPALGGWLLYRGLKPRRYAHEKNDCQEPGPPGGSAGGPCPPIQSLRVISLSDPANHLGFGAPFEKCDAAKRENAHSAPGVVLVELAGRQGVL